MQLRCGVLEWFSAQHWLADIFATAFSNLRMVGVFVPLRLSPSACWVGGRTQAKSRVAWSKRFGRPGLQSLNDSIPEKPWLGLQDHIAADLCALIDVRGLLPCRQIDIAGLQQAVILLERDDRALDFGAVDAVGLNLTTICSTITIRRQGCLHVANSVAGLAEPRDAIVYRRPGQNAISKLRLHRQPAIRQITNIVFVLLVIACIHVEVHMDAPSGRKVQSQVVLSAKRLSVFDIISSIDRDPGHMSNASNNFAPLLIHDLDKTGVRTDRIDVSSDGRRNIDLPSGSSCDRLRVLKNEIFRDQHLVLPQISISIRFGVDDLLKLSADERVRPIAASIPGKHVLGLSDSSVGHPDVSVGTRMMRNEVVERIRLLVSFTVTIVDILLDIIGSWRFRHKSPVFFKSKSTCAIQIFPHVTAAEICLTYCF